MTDQPRLAPDSIAALEAVGKDAEPPVASPPAEYSAEYERGWNDCRALILKTLGANP